MTDQQADLRQEKIRKASHQIYDILAGFSVGESREITRSVESMVNYRSIIPEHQRRMGTLFDVADAQQEASQATTANNGVEGD
jgi:hypothetical protein